MAKESGLGWSGLDVDDSAGSPNDIRSDVNSLSFSTPRAVQDVTGIDKSAIERLLLLADFSVDLNGVFNDAANKSHATFKTVPSTAVPRTTTITVSGQTLAGELLYTDYALSRSNTGELPWRTTGVLADGVIPAWS